jgi:hypothetical protein
MKSEISGPLLKNLYCNLIKKYGIFYKEIQDLSYILLNGVSVKLEK